MNEPGPAQLALIRRYARTMREMHADAMALRGPRFGTRKDAAPSEAIRQAGEAQRFRRGSDAGEAQDPAR